MFSLTSRAIIYGRHLDVASRMLDFDYLSSRTPSVAGIIDPNSQKTTYTKLFYGEGEILVPVYPNIASIPLSESIDTFLNFASFRSATLATWEALRSDRFDHIVIIAEGIPEREMREIIAYNESLLSPKRIIGPATAGAIVGGVLRMGNSGGSLENIITSRLYKQGSIGFVSRSGGMSNEMYRVISQRTDGIHTGIALGGDRFVAATFRDIVRDYEANPEIRMIVLLGEVGSRDELEIVELLKAKKITKPIVAYVSGAFAEYLGTEVQFGHAGAKANQAEETASYKNQALRAAGAYVPESYIEFGDMIRDVYLSEVNRDFVPFSGIDPDIERKLQVIQKRTPTHFTSTISDERGEELHYNHRPISEYVASGSISRVIANLWFKRDLSSEMLTIFDTIVILLADHGPAVSGATNTIITARAGKDILSSLVAGLLTIGPRFGGAIDGAIRTWYEGVQSGEAPETLIARMKKGGNPIQGIGHKVKSKFNPDARCTILGEQAAILRSKKYLEYALAVESLTLEKKPNLILNVDGYIAAVLLDMFTDIGMSDEEIASLIDAGIANAFFILSRTIGFIGHALDQKRLGEGLYRTPWEDILYTE